MGVFVYVGNLGHSLNEDAVRKAFVAGGSAVKSVIVMRSPQNDRSRGFGFVEVESEEEAAAAMLAMNGVEVEGQALKVSAARQAISRSRDGRGFDSYSGLGRSTGPRRPGGAKRKSR